MGKLQKIAELLEIEVTRLLDDYNRFLQEGQGRRIRALRKSMGLMQAEFGKLYGIHGGTVKKWEGEKVRIYKSTWEKLFQTS